MDAPTRVTLFCLIGRRGVQPAGSTEVVRTGGLGFGEGRVKFPLYTWKLGKASTEPPAAAGQDPIDRTDVAL